MKTYKIESRYSDVPYFVVYTDNLDLFKLFTGPRCKITDITPETGEDDE
jgi:hypothetical protein